ncbi:MAG: thiol protease/hemagglutinin PrtT [Bacteroidales bacterium]|nr:thiol protease/hemagglutinin PrtT [Bacteroidales bacterium]
MKKALILSFCLFFLFTAGFARKRTVDQLETIATTHFASPQAQGISRSIAETEPQLLSSSNEILAESLKETADTTSAFYVYGYPTGGFVIISSDDCAKSILGYSDGQFNRNTLPGNMRYWLSVYADEIHAASASSDVTTQSNEYDSSSPAYSVTISPLLGNIMWDQDAPYSNKVPDQMLTGCVATAMAQVMKYYEYPAKGIGSHSYSYNGRTFSANFAASTYDWNNMLDVYSGVNYSIVEANAVATLMYDCGVSVDMQYTPDGSGAELFGIAEALISYFGYDPNMQYYSRDYYYSNEWMNMLKKELNEARPVLYFANDDKETYGHAFVVDGYDTNNRMHINWGWSGDLNGYFVINALNIESADIDLSSVQSFIGGLQPKTSGTSYTPQLDLIDELTLNSSAVARSASFIVNGNMLYNNGTAFSGAVSGALYKENSFVCTVGDVRKNATIASDMKIAVSSSAFTIPSNVSSGDYQLYLVAQGKNSNQWERVRIKNGLRNYYNVHVTETSVSFSEPKLSDVINVTSVISDNKLYSTYTGNFTMNVKTFSREFNSYIGVELVSTSDTTHQIVDYRRPFLAEFSSSDFTFSGSIALPAGSYKLYPVYSADRKKWERLYSAERAETVIVYPKPSGHYTIEQTSGFTILRSPIATKDMLEMSVGLKNTGTAPFDRTLIVRISTPDNVNILKFNYPVFVETNTTQTVHFSFPVELNVGNYKVTLYYIDGDGNTRLLSNKTDQIGTFSVSKDVMGVDEPRSDDSLQIFPTVASDYLNVVSEQEIQSVEVVNSSGSVVDFIKTDGKYCQFPVIHLKSGLYLLRITTTEGSIVRKFIRQ